MPHTVLLAAIVGAHGLKGEVRVKSFARTGVSLDAYGPLSDETGRSFTVRAVRPGPKDEQLVVFEEIRDRTAAEVLRGVKLYVPRDALPATTGDEFYHTDLIGLAAVDGDGAHIGKVVAVHNFGAGDILEIARGDGGEILIGFTHATVPAIDLKAGRLTVIEPQAVEAAKDDGGDVAP
ncbi:MAG: ribosome maturation factor RimM [Rhizomicrobium sp.]